ncbi:MAG: RNA methyltransferase [Acidiferrobacteraceae bacterium]
MTENANRNTADALTNIRVVLVEPSHPGNVGGAARAMKNSGLSDLRLVSPLIFPHPDAIARAAGAEDILENATVTGTLEDALAECRLVVGTSARRRTIPVPPLAPEEAAHRLLAEAQRGPVALVFGRERTGLTNAELDRCQHLVTIPADPRFSSLNLAGAVQVLGYELFSAAATTAATTVARRAELASRAQMHHFYEHLERVLIDLEFLNPQAPRKLMRRVMRLIDRAHPDTNEINILEGILTAAERLARDTDDPANT